MKLKKEYVQVLKSTKDWEEAIHMASVPLINDSIINENYIHKMISNIKDMGPYVVISQDIALPHARPEDGAFESAISILKLEDRVSFGKDKNVCVIYSILKGHCFQNTGFKILSSSAQWTFPVIYHTNLTFRDCFPQMNLEDLTLLKCFLRHWFWKKS